ncbi:TIR domain-containing protein [Paraburkholderia fungorum]|uniref:TIR domain-containing protein n=1 Tax=Paraburkholderia fungorum TaxID=134537 RepID=UPI0003F9C467|nr:TIR domain-containing protein [Paraburkholderia fungorum]PZR43899.1 MAG: TIR-like domain-containing protein [Paraburkholderia fungorum]
MARQTFFSFRYKKDNWRANVVRNSWVTQERSAAGFFDSAEWEKVKKNTDANIEKWIDSQMTGTSVTVVLIGSDTAGKKWIEYEIKASHTRGNGIIGIYIHGIKDSSGNTTTQGKNPFDNIIFKKNGIIVNYPVYDWIIDDGYKNLGAWIEKAAVAAGK